MVQRVTPERLASGMGKIIAIAVMLASGPAYGVDLPIPVGSYYQGEVNGKRQPHGRGELTLPDGRRYEGRFRKGLIRSLSLIQDKTPEPPEVEAPAAALAPVEVAAHSDEEAFGPWEWNWGDGRRYEGDTLDGNPHGRGVWIWPDGRRLAGEFRDGRLVTEADR